MKNESCSHISRQFSNQHGSTSTSVPNAEDSSAKKGVDPIELGNALLEFKRRRRYKRLSKAHDKFMEEYGR